MANFYGPDGCLILFDESALQGFFGGELDNKKFQEASHQWNGISYDNQNSLAQFCVKQGWRDLVKNILEVSKLNSSEYFFDKIKNSIFQEAAMLGQANILEDMFSTHGDDFDSHIFFYLFYEVARTSNLAILNILAPYQDKGSVAYALEQLLCHKPEDEVTIEHIYNLLDEDTLGPLREKRQKMAGWDKNDRYVADFLTARHKIDLDKKAILNAVEPRLTQKDSGQEYNPCEQGIHQGPKGRKPKKI